MSVQEFRRGFSGPDQGIARVARLPDLGAAGSALVGMGLALAMLALRWAASSVYGDVAGFMILLPGVLIAALAGGRIAGGVAVAACMVGGPVVVDFSTGRPLGSVLNTETGRLAWISFGLVGIFCTLVAASLRRTVRRLDQAAAALRASDTRIGDAETRLNLVSELAPAMLWMSDAQGRCVHMNHALRAFWGAAAEAGDFDFLDAVHPEDRARVVAAGRRALETGAPMEVEARYRRHDGAWRLLLTRARLRLRPDGGVEGMVGVNTDITDARAAEAALRTSEATLKATVDQAAAGIARVGLDGRVVTANARFADLLGLSEDRLKGISTGDVTHPDDI